MIFCHLQLCEPGQVPKFLCLSFLICKVRALRIDKFVCIKYIEECLLYSKYSIYIRYSVHSVGLKWVVIKILSFRKLARLCYICD